MTMLYDVDITDLYWDCAEYALRRTGSLLTLDTLLYSEGNKLRSWGELQVGDILCWFVPEVAHYHLPLQIKDRTLIAPSMSVARHFGVYEGDCYVSDLTFVKDCPILRMREFSSLHLPNRYFRSE